MLAARPGSLAARAPRPPPLQPPQRAPAAGPQWRRCRCRAGCSRQPPGLGGHVRLAPVHWTGSTVSLVAAAAASDAGDNQAGGPVQPKPALPAYQNPKFWTMITLFFLMSFVNTILDSLGTSLVITSAGGGAAVIPFLTVYAVWPCSLVFLVLYSLATQRFSRGTVFNLTVSGFLAFMAAFGCLYPSHEAMHLTGFADRALTSLPVGLAGAVGLVRNWMFSLFYCASELWGDCVLSLLFWTLANAVTSVEESVGLYPLFGIGANVGQALSGRFLSIWGSRWGAHLSHVQQVQVLMALVCCIGVAIMGLHTLASRTFSPPGPLPSLPPAPAAAAAAAGEPAAGQRRQAKAGGKPALREIVQFLAGSPHIRCLAVMALSQGLATNLVDIAWKSHLHMLHPSPAAYAAFMGDVAMWTGFVTGAMMLVSPSLFKRLGWRGVARATPEFLRWTGVPFFAGCVAFALLRPQPPGPPLRLLVIAGALLQVFGKGAKFSLFKPAEEMVYIGLDEESRTKGKAAIDVVGAQTGKSVGSVLQQVLLVASAGSMGRSLPVLAVAYWCILIAWLSAVDRLAAHRRGALTGAAAA